MTKFEECMFQLKIINAALAQANMNLEDCLVKLGLAEEKCSECGMELKEEDEGKICNSCYKRLSAEHYYERRHPDEK